MLLLMGERFGLRNPVDEIGQVGQRGWRGFGQLLRRGWCRRKGPQCTGQGERGLSP